ncbi:hypothetical protein [Psychrobacter celer]|uniref:hypothetical protein n=1 Tax=Psychrobacter celer TaxID=306572 RepID=UPI003FD22422
MKNIILILILAITTQGHANVSKNHDDFLTENLIEMQYWSNTIKRLDAELEESNTDMYQELICKRREVVRDYIEFLDKTYNSQELLNLSRDNNDFIGAREDILVAKKNWQLGIDLFDKELREELNFNPSFTFVTLDYICNKTGY